MRCRRPFLFLLPGLILMVAGCCPPAVSSTQFVLHADQPVAVQQPRVD